MQLDWTETIAGYSMLQIRDLLKRPPPTFEPSAIVERLGRAGDPDLLLEEMLSRGWLERSATGQIEQTVKGNGVAMAKKLKPLSRSEAERTLELVVAAAHEINGDDRYSHDVSDLAVFGSYLSDVATLSDVDIAYTLNARWREGSGKTMEEVSARSHAAFPPPKSADWMGRLFWPEKVVTRKLRVTRRVSLEELKTVRHYGWRYRLLLGKD